MRIICWFLLLFITISCKKSDPLYPFDQENIPEEGLSPEDDAIIAAQETRQFKPSELIFFDGETVESFLARTNPTLLINWGKGIRNPGNSFDMPVERTRIDNAFNVLGVREYKDFVNFLLDEGTRLTDTENPQWNKNAQPDTTLIPILIPFSRPAQKGLAYVFTSDNSLDKRKIAGDCNLLLYGLDCSAFVTHMFNKASLNINNQPAAALSNEVVMNSFIQKNLPNLGYVYIDKEKGSFGINNDVQAGDIIYFLKDQTLTLRGNVKEKLQYAFHIGIALIPKDKTDIYIFQSNGEKSKSKKGAEKPLPGCERYSPQEGRGPRTVPTKNIIKWPGFSNYGLLKLIPVDPTNKPPQNIGDLIGKWYLQELIEIEGNNPPKQTLYHNGEFVEIRDDKIYIVDDKEKPACGGNYSVTGNNIHVKSGCQIFGLLDLTIQKLTPNQLILTQTVVEGGKTIKRTLTATK